MANNRKIGKVAKINNKGGPNPDSYIIEDEDGATYLVHVGDIQENEEILYKLGDEGKTSTLQVGDTVEFEPISSECAMHVKKTS